MALYLHSNLRCGLHKTHIQWNSGSNGRSRSKVFDFFVPVERILFCEYSHQKHGKYCTILNFSHIWSLGHVWSGSDSLKFAQGWSLNQPLAQERLLQATWSLGRCSISHLRTIETIEMLPESLKLCILNLNYYWHWCWMYSYIHTYIYWIYIYWIRQTHNHNVAKLNLCNCVSCNQLHLIQDQPGPTAVELF